jgi:NAD+ synthase
MNCAAVRDTIVDWLRNQLQMSGQNGFVVGVSGGVDSALVSTLCALTGKPTILISMPIHQALDQLKRAEEHIDWLAGKFPTTVQGFNTNLTEPFEAMQKVFPENVGLDELAAANIRSRLRMVALYAFANHHKCLVSGTGNLIEDFGVGFFTKYGDGGVDLSPIGNLSKTQVWELAQFIGVSDAIVHAKPTDGLWKDNRGDEDTIGASYPELEWAMAECEIKGFINHTDQNSALPVFDPNYTQRQRIVMSIYLQRHALGKHKLSPIPVCKIPQVIL